MAKVTRCDRCGKEVKPRKIFKRIIRPLSDDAYDVTLSQELEMWGEIDKKYDLCADCYYELKEWLTGNKTWEVEKEE